MENNRIERKQEIVGNRCGYFKTMMKVFARRRFKPRSLEKGRKTEAEGVDSAELLIGPERS